MIREYVYRCRRCDSTKTIVEDTERTGQPIQGPPTDMVVCGVRDCNGKADLITT